MANNTIQVKRTAVAGRTPNTTNIANTQYISAGEFALNMTDGILYSSNGTALIEVGANTTTQRISNSVIVGNTTISTTNAIFGGTIAANGSIGSAGQVLTSGAAGNVYWSSVAGGSGSTYMKGGASTVGTLASEGQNIFRVNANTLNNNTTFVAGENAQATGPLTVASGITLSIQTGARVSII